MEFPTRVEIDLDRLHDNLAAIRRYTGGRRLLLVVKADAYGHGAEVVAAEALKAGVDMLGVATVHEGVQLRRAGIMGPVLVPSPCLMCEAEAIVRYGLRCTVSRLPFLEALAAACARAGTVLPVHVEVDTGMGRSGLSPPAVPAMLQAIAAHPGVQLEGLYTHFPDADAPDPSFAHRQLEEFARLRERLDAEGLGAAVYHAANSAGLVHLPASHLDMVRPGLLAYGHRPAGGAGPGGAAPGGAAPAAPAVRPVMSFRTRLVQIRELPPGATVSYGRTFTSPRPMRVGVVAAGYGHGLALGLSDRGQLLLRGRRVPIVGRVTMDMTMVDLSAVTAAEIEDEVVIFGSAAGATITLEELARWSGTIPYEIMCSIGKRVPRVFRRAGQTVRITTLIGERRRRAADAPRGAPIQAPVCGPASGGPPAAGAPGRAARRPGRSTRGAGARDRASRGRNAPGP